MERAGLVRDHHPSVKPWRRRALVSALSLFLAIIPRPGISADAALEQSIRGEISRDCYARALWGIQVVNDSTGESLFEINPRKLLKPASTAKLFTGALALDRLGPDFRIKTDLLLHGRVSKRGTLLGDLILYGRGDFSFAARFIEGDSTRSLDRIVDALDGAEIRRITGAIITDDSFFRGPSFGSGWTWDDLQYYYGAAVSSLTTDDNVVDLIFTPGASAGDPVRIDIRPQTDYLILQTNNLRTGAKGTPRRITLTRSLHSRSVSCDGSLPVGSDPWIDAATVPDAPHFFAHRLRERLQERGVRVRRGLRHDPGIVSRLEKSQTSDRRLVVQSPPLSIMLPRMMKPSQNLYAQLLLLHVGVGSAAAGTNETTEESGIRELNGFVERLGIPSGEVLLDDGSGLSRSCLVTPNAVVTLLRFMKRHASGNAFMDSLPVAGVDGTLRRRFKGTAAEGNLRAKTGSLRYVSALSGWVTNRSGERLVFGVMLNGYEPRAGEPSAREAVDQIGKLLAESGAAATP